MCEWIKLKIADCLSDHWAGVWGTEPQDQGGSRVYRSTEIDDNGHLNMGAGVERNIPSSVFERAIRRGDILLETSGGSPERPVGRVALVAEDPQERSFCSNFIRVLRSNGRITPEYLAWSLMRLNKSPQILRYQQQTTGIINLNLRDFLQHEIDLPRNVCEQDRRCQMLRLIDTQITHTEAVLAKQEQLQAGLMQDLFTRGVDETGRLRPLREEAPELYRETKLGWLPREWETVLLSERAPRNGGHLKTGPFGSSLKISHWVETGHPVITIGCLGVGRFIEDELLFVSEETARLLKGYRVVSDDIVFSRVADVGRSVVVDEVSQGWIILSNLMRLRVDSARLRPEMIHLQLAHYPGLRSQLRKTVNSSGRDLANAETLNALRFLAPPVSEQDRICELAHREQRFIEIETTLLDKLRRQRTALLRDLLTPPAAAAEPRIAAE